MMNYIFFIASFNAFFFLGLLLQKKVKQLHDKILGFWLLYLGIATATYAFSIDFFPASPLLSSGIIALFLLHGPFLYLYVSALALNRRKFKLKKLWHFLPFIAFILYLLIAFRFSTYSKGIRVDHVAENGIEPPLLFVFFLIITALSGPVYFFISYKKFQQIKKSPSGKLNNQPGFNWLGKLIPIFGIVWTALIIIAVIHHVFHLFSMAFCTDGLFLSLSVFIILIGYFGLKQKEVFISYALDETEKAKSAEKEIPNEPEIKYAATKMEGEELQKCCNRVGQYINTNKPYLEPDLTLPKLAEELNISTHHLSQVINEKHERNFADFINSYRVAEVKRKIQDPEFKNYSLLGIAFESGFNSKSAFNRVFKNQTGMTPSEFRKSVSSS